jgi:hypothetical protein
MPNNNEKMASWQLFHYARKYLGRSSLYRIWGTKNARKVDYWAQNPRFTNKVDNAFDPLSGVRDMLSMLDDRGHTDAVRSAVAFIVSGTSLDQGQYELSPVSELQATIGEEILLDYRVVGDLQRAIEANASIDEVERLKALAIAEIERTAAKYYLDNNDLDV